MARTLRPLGGLLLALALQAATETESATQAPQRFVARADAVRVDVLVLRDRRLVQGLSPSDFEIRDNGVVQRIEGIEVEHLPLNLLCVFDTSSSVRGPRLAQLRDAGRALLARLQPGDRAALLSFANRVELLAPIGDDRSAMAAALDRMSGANRTSLRDAVFAGLALREADQGRTLLLLFSDGQDTASWLTRAQVIDTAKRTDVVAYAVAVRGASGRYGRFLDELTEETGGRVMIADSESDLGPTFVRILSEFRDRYVLTYQPAGVAGAGWHRLDVRLKGTRGTVVARRGYFSD
jgi:VWFA-related protein